MKTRRTGIFILAAAAAAMLAVSTIDAEALASMILAPTHEPVQGNPTAHHGSPAPFNYPAHAPANATWGSLFSTHWR
jgi:hypothetical protein